MTLRKDNRKRRASGRKQPKTKRRLLWTLIGLPVAGAVTVAVYRRFAQEREDSRSTGPAVAQETSGVRSGSTVFDPLIGRWQRPDGGYVMEIRSIDASGTMDARY